MDFEKYRYKVKYVSWHDDPSANAAYRADVNRLNEEFKRDLLNELGIAGHARADDLYRIAFDIGHSSGNWHSVVYGYAEELSALLK